MREDSSWPAGVGAASVHEAPPAGAADRAASAASRPESAPAGRDRAWVLRAERPRTQVVGCELIYLVDVVTPDQEEGENADADAEADE